MEKNTAENRKPLEPDFIVKLSKETELSKIYELLDEVIFDLLEFKIKEGRCGDILANEIYSLKVLRDSFKEYQHPNI